VPYGSRSLGGDPGARLGARGKDPEVRPAPLFINGSPGGASTALTPSSTTTVNVMKVAWR
jgi:hypothetical protein